MKTALILTIHGDKWLIPQATTTDAGRLLALFGNAIMVQQDYDRSTLSPVYTAVEYTSGIQRADPQVAMVNVKSVRLPAPAKDDTTRSNRAKPVQAISSTPILRLEGGGS